MSFSVTVIVVRIRVLRVTLFRLLSEVFLNYRYALRVFGRDARLPKYLALVQSTFGGLLLGRCVVALTLRLHLRVEGVQGKLLVSHGSRRWLTACVCQVKLQDHVGLLAEGWLALCFLDLSYLVLKHHLKTVGHHTGELLDVLRAGIDIS